MARKTIAGIADLIEDMVDKDRNDATFNTFVEAMINLTLQEIISEVPHARWLLDESTVTTVASTQYVAIPSDMDIDMLVSARDETNQRPLRRISPADADMIDPGRDLTGDEILYWFLRIGGVDRLYFLHQPDSADTLTFTFGNLVDDTASASSSPLPAKYEWVLIAGTLIKVWERLDPQHDTTKHARIFERGLQQIIRDANSLPGGFEALASHRPNFKNRVEGASWPANFDVSQ